MNVLAFTAAIGCASLGAGLLGALTGLGGGVVIVPLWTLAFGIDAFRGGSDSVPDIERHRSQGRSNYGVGVNAAQPITDGLRAFGRVGWNEGHNESFAYTEVNPSVALGAEPRVLA